MISSYRNLKNQHFFEFKKLDYPEKLLLKNNGGTTFSCEPNLRNGYISELPRVLESTYTVTEKEPYEYINEVVSNLIFIFKFIPRVVVYS